MTLADYQEKAGALEAAIMSLSEAKNVLEENYSLVDKRTCKVKRNIALLYLKLNRFEEALNELREVEELELTLYGDRSIQLAKTLKKIGILFII